MNDFAANFVGAIPGYYDSDLVPNIFIDYAYDMAGRVADLKPGSVLEMASGTGVVTRLLRDKLPAETSLVASDLNEPMLDIARTKFSEGEAVSFQTINAMDIPMGDGTLDLITCQFGVMFFPDKVQSYREARRVLKDGGHYLFSAWDAHEFNPFARIGQELIEELFPDNPPGFYYVPFHYNDPDEIKRDMEEAGFMDVKVERVQINKTVTSLENFARGFVRGNALIEELKQRNFDPDEMIEKLRAAWADAFGTNPSVMPLSIYMVAGKKRYAAEETGLTQ